MKVHIFILPVHSENDGEQSIVIHDKIGKDEFISR